MKKHKNVKLNIFGVKVLIRISYPRKKKKKSDPKIKFYNLHLNKYLYFALFLPLLISLSFLLKDNLIVPSYATANTKLLSLISPALSFVPDKYPSPPPKPKEEIVFHGPTQKKQVALTFDADMTPQMKLDLQTGYVKSYFDNNLIKILEETGTKATLFLSGMWIESYRDQARSLSRNSLFELGNHTYSHPAFEGACYGLPLAENSHKNEELQKTQKLLKDLSGFDNKLFRFPGGCYSKADLEMVAKTGQTAIQWDVAGQDGFNGNTEQIISNVTDNVKNGSIIVMHMNGYPNEPATAAALPLIISILHEKGYEFVTVSELLNYPIARRPEHVKLVSNLQIDR